jgi:hypothetical protein
MDIFPLNLQSPEFLDGHVKGCIRGKGCGNARLDPRDGRWRYCAAVLCVGYNADSSRPGGSELDEGEHGPDADEPRGGIAWLPRSSLAEAQPKPPEGTHSQRVPSLGLSWHIILPERRSSAL